MNPAIFSSHLWAVIVFTLSYGLIYGINNSLTEFMYLLPGAHLVHIPSGFKLLFVLIGGPWAAIGITLVCLTAGLWFMFPGGLGLCLALAAVNGLAPLWALKLLLGKACLPPDLSRLSVRKFLQLGCLFAFLNTSLNQMVLYWSGVTDNFTGGMVVMFLGDLTGCYLVMLLVQAVGRRVYRRPRPSDEKDLNSYQMCVKILMDFSVFLPPNFH